MRLSTVCFVLSIAFAITRADPSIANETTTNRESKVTAAKTLSLLEAQLALRQAQLRLNLYRYVDYPRQRRELDDAIKLTEAEIKLFERRILDYRPFRTVGRYSPTYTAEQNYRHQLLATSQYLRQLKDQRTDHWRYHADRCRLLELEVLHAAIVLNRELHGQPQPTALPWGSTTRSYFTCNP